MMWPFKKEQVEEEIEVEKPTTTLSVLDEFDDPWHIDVSESFQERTTLYEIVVFRLDISEWSALHDSSREVLGIQRSEYKRLITEVFNGDTSSGYHTYFNNKEDAERAINEFRPYYDSYHTPKAIAERLSFYDEGSYPPYFSHHTKDIKPQKIKEEVF